MCKLSKLNRNCNDKILTLQVRDTFTNYVMEKENERKGDLINVLTLTIQLWATLLLPYTMYFLLQKVKELSRIQEPKNGPKV